MDTLSLISVIIPTYNRIEFLTKCLNSILNQTYSNIEILVVDDGSTDATEAQVLEMSKKIKYHKLEKNGNLSFLRNYGIRMSKGQYIAFCDDDDLWHENKLMTQMEYMLEADLVCSNAVEIDKTGQITSEMHFSAVRSQGPISTVDLLQENCIITSSVLLNRQIISGSILFVETKKRRGEDYLVWLELSKIHKLYYITNPLISYRIHENNLSFLNFEERIKLLVDTIEIRKSYWESTNRKIADASKIGCIELYKELTKLSYIHRNYRDCVKYTSEVLNLKNYIGSCKQIKFHMYRILFYLLYKLGMK